MDQNSHATVNTPNELLDTSIIYSRQQIDTSNELQDTSLIHSRQRTDMFTKNKLNGLPLANREEPGSATGWSFGSGRTTFTEGQVSELRDTSAARSPARCVETFTEGKVYEPILHTNTVLTTILNKLYSDEEFLKNISRLEAGTDKSKKKAVAIKKTINGIRVYGSVEQPLLLARDVGILMGISNIRLQVKYFNSSEKIIGLYKYGNGKTTKLEFLTWKGVVRAANNSRSTLSDLFREFIYELVAMAVGNPDLLDSVAKRVVEKNPELVAAAREELNQNMNCYKKLYELEASQRRLLQHNYEDEVQKRLIMENKRAEAELDLEIAKINAKHLMQQKRHYEQYIQNILEYPGADEQELRILRQRFMKPLCIYMLNPQYLCAILKKSDDATDAFFQYAPEYPDQVKYILERKKEIESAPIKNRSVDSVATNIVRSLVPPNTHYYFYLHSGRELLQDELVYITTEWVLDAKHMAAVVAQLNGECENILIKKRRIYYATLDEIRDIIQQQLLAQPKI